METILNGCQTFFLFLKLETFFLFAINWICLLHVIATMNSYIFTLGFEYARLKTILIFFSKKEEERRLYIYIEKWDQTGSPEIPDR